MSKNFAGNLGGLNVGVFEISNRPSISMAAIIGKKIVSYNLVSGNLQGAFDRCIYFIALGDQENAEDIAIYFSRLTSQIIVKNR